MRTEKRAYRIRKATDEEIAGMNYFNNPLVIEYKGKVCILNAGNGDNRTVFRYDKGFAVLSTNYRLGYAGLQIIHEDMTSGMEDEVFFQNTDELRDELKKDFFDYSENVQADILAQYINY